MKRDTRTPFLLMSAALAGGLLVAGGCEVDTFFDPSKPVYMQYTPTTTPILERLDAIESGDDQWAGATDVQPEDLLPSTLEYRLAAGDIVTVEIYELLLPGTFTVVQKRVDQTGNIRLPPPLRDFPAAGLTPREVEDAIIDFLDPDYIRDPIVTVSLDQGQGLLYTVEGNIPRTSIYQISKPDLRLSEALALAGGAPPTTNYIYVVRPVTIGEGFDPFPGRTPPTPPSGGAGGNEQEQPVDIDDLIDDLEGGNGGNGTSPGVLNAPAGMPETQLAGALDEPGGLRRISDEPWLDVDDFNPSGSGKGRRIEAQASFIYVPDRDEWVPVHATRPQDGVVDEIIASGGGEPVLERIIEIPFRKLLNDNSYNIVVRPGDRIYVDPPAFGVVYIGGEVFRPGVYQLPSTGRLTLSQLVTAAGGMSTLAIPSRIDFTRRVGENREATLRLNMGAIRQKTEPDIFLKPDDHILVGTSFFAYPLAIIRNGFRTTYGFGFLLDRNFGSDVFGAPPRSFGN